MQLKRKLAAISSAAALAAGVVVAFAGPAAAVNDVHMCVTDSQGVFECAFASGTNVDIGRDAGDEFDVPSIRGQIKDVPTGLCMTVNSSNNVVLATCHGNSNQEWIEESGAHNTFQYVNVSNLLCLNDKYFAGIVNTATCGFSNPNQDWNN